MGSFHPGRNPTVSHQKNIDQNLTMPTMESLSISSGQYSFLADPCKINPVLYLLYLYIKKNDNAIFLNDDAIKKNDKAIFLNYDALKKMITLLLHGSGDVGVEGVGVGEVGVEAVGMGVVGEGVVR